jgi:hypothetical protein
LVSVEKDKMLALASLSDISKFIPFVNTADNIDLLPVAFNACVVNRINQNDDITDTATALAIRNNFVYKPINVEHDRSKVIGVILTTGFSEFGTDRPLTEEEVKGKDIPFNIVLGGLVWRVVDPELSDRIEESNDPTSPWYLRVSASWELGFTGYNLVVMPAGQKNLSDGRIISNASDIELLMKNLKSEGGDGLYNDQRIYRMPSEEVLPLGIGFTQNPAAEVRGVATQQDETVTLVEVAEEVASSGTFPTTSDLQASVSINTPKIEQPENKISQSQIPDVKKERIDMKLTSIKDITDENLKQCAASDVAAVIEAELLKGNEAWLKEKNSLTETLATTQATADKANQDNAKLQEEMKQLQATVDTLAKEKTERDSVDRFNTRMNEVCAAYEFEDDVRAAVVEEIKAIDSDEDFGKWKTKAAVLLKGYAKKFKPFAKKGDKEDAKDGNDSEVKEGEAKKCKAGDGETPAKCEDKKEMKAAIASAIDNAVPEVAPQIPNTASAKEPTLKEKYADAFSPKNFTIKI